MSRALSLVAGAWSIPLALYGGTWLVGLLLSTAGGLLMGWASWKEFQAEGGKFNLGTASTPPPAPPVAPAPPRLIGAPRRSRRRFGDISTEV